MSNIQERINLCLQNLRERGTVDKTIGIYLFEHKYKNYSDTVVQMDLWRIKVRLTISPDKDDYRILVEEIHNKDHHEQDSISGDFYVEEDEIELIFQNILYSYKVVQK